MRRFPILFSILALLATSSCEKQEEAEEPDYDNMVMADEEDEWTTGQEFNGKLITGDLPDAQEHSILEIPGEEKEGSFEELL
jgi:hypothetical protein